MQQPVTMGAPQKSYASSPHSSVIMQPQQNYVGGPTPQNKGYGPQQQQNVSYNRPQQQPADALPTQNYDSQKKSFGYYSVGAIVLAVLVVITIIAQDVVFVRFVESSSVKVLRYGIPAEVITVAGCFMVMPGFAVYELFIIGAFIAGLNVFRYFFLVAAFAFVLVDFNQYFYYGSGSRHEFKSARKAVIALLVLSALFFLLHIGWLVACVLAYRDEKKKELASRAAVAVIAPPVAGGIVGTGTPMQSQTAVTPTQSRTATGKSKSVITPVKVEGEKAPGQSKTPKAAEEGKAPTAQAKLSVMDKIKRSFGRDPKKNKKMSDGSIEGIHTE